MKQTHILAALLNHFRHEDPGLYFIRFLLTTDFLTLNILYPPAGNAVSACEMDTVDPRAYYMFCSETELCDELGDIFVAHFGSLSVH